MTPFLRDHRAFSLVELLVAIALIAIAIALFYSVGGAMVARSQEAACVANLRNLSAALMNLANENGGVIRTKQSGSGNNWALWTAQLYDGGYVESKKTFVCPSWPRAVDFENVNWKWYTYGLNLFDPRAKVFTLDEDPVYQYFLNIRTIDNPSSCTLLMDSCSQVAGLEKGSQTFRVWTQKASSSDRSAVHLRHQGAAFIAFLDGHIGRLRRDDLKALGFSAYYDRDGVLVSRF